MVNRTMQAKSLKLKRQKRAWARVYSTPSGVRPNSEIVEEYKQRSKTVVAFTEIDYVIQTVTGQLPGSQGKLSRLYLEELVRVREQNPQMYELRLVNNCFMLVQCFWNSNGAVLVEKDKKKKTVRRSIQYKNAADAIHRFKKERVLWISRIGTRSSSGPPPDV